MGVLKSLVLSVETGGGERTENSMPFGLIPARRENSISCAKPEAEREETSSA
jgi:hypothetical protein